MTARITLRDVAAACGFDVSTVSRALAGDARVAEATATAVRAAAARLGYRPNLAARALQAGATRTIWFLVGSLEHSVDRNLTASAGRVLSDDGYETLVAVHHGDDATYERILTRLDQGLADGALITPGYRRHPDSPALRRLVERRFPLVFLDRAPSRLRVATVTTDNQDATKRLIQELAAAGVRRLVVCEDAANVVAALRRETALREAGRLGIDARMADAGSAWIRSGSGATGVLGSTQEQVLDWYRPHRADLAASDLRFAVFDNWIGEPHPAASVAVAIQDFAGMAAQAARRLLTAIRDPAQVTSASDALPILRIDHIT